MVRDWRPESLFFVKSMLMWAGSIDEFRCHVTVKLFGVSMVPEVGERISRAAAKGRRRERSVVEVIKKCILIRLWL